MKQSYVSSVNLTALPLSLLGGIHPWWHVFHCVHNLRFRTLKQMLIIHLCSLEDASVGCGGVNSCGTKISCREQSLIRFTAELIILFFRFTFPRAFSMWFKDGKSSKYGNPQSTTHENCLTLPTKHRNRKEKESAWLQNKPFSALQGWLSLLNFQVLSS